MNKFISAFLLIVSINVNSQEKQTKIFAPFNPKALVYKLADINPDLYQFNGAIKTINTNSYSLDEFDQKGRLTQSFSFDNSGHKKITKKYIYTDAFTIKTTTYVDEGGIINGEYKLDKSGNIISYIYVGGENAPDYYDKYSIRYEYNNGLLTKEIVDVSVKGYEHKNEITTYKYDEKGRIVESRFWYDANEDIGFLNTYDYSSFDKDKSILAFIGNRYFEKSYTYNKNLTLVNQTVKEGDYYSSDFFEGYDSPLYDTFGNLISASSTTIIYTYY